MCVRRRYLYDSLVCESGSGCRWEREWVGGRGLGGLGGWKGGGDGVQRRVATGVGAECRRV